MNRTWLTIVAGMVAMGGCSSVLQTDQVRSKDEVIAALSGKGVIYALPKQYLRMTVTLADQPVPTAAQLKREKELRAAVAKATLALAEAKTKVDKEKATKAKLDADNALKKHKATYDKVKGVTTVFANGAIIADPDATFRVDYDHRIWRTETVVIETDAKGFLLLAETKTKDEIPDIAKRVIDVAADAAAFFASGGLSGVLSGALPAVLPQVSVRAELPEPCDRQKDFSVTVLIDPMNPIRAARDLNEQARRQTKQFGLDCMVIELHDAALELVHDTSVNVAIPPDEKQAIKQCRGPNGNPIPGAPVWCDLSEFRVAAKERRSVATCADGLCFPRPGTLFLRVRSRSNVIADLTGLVQVDIPQAGEVGLLDFRRGAFVESEARATFENGYLTKMEYTDPSELAGFVSIPVDALKAIFGIPAAIFDTGKTKAESQAAIAQANADLLQQQIAIVERQRQLQALLNDAAGP